MFGALHPRADIPKKERGQEMNSIEFIYNIAKKGLQNYLKLKKRDKYLGMVFRQQPIEDDEY